MRTIYIDKEFRCHVSPGDNLTPLETDAFDDKCDALIEAYRFVPEGRSWTREDGTAFEGEMITPATDLAVPLAVQEEYEKLNAKLAESYRRGVDSV